MSTQAGPNGPNTVGDSVVATINPLDASGNPAVLRTGSVPSWSSDNPSVCTVTPASNGMTATLTFVADGTANISVQAISDLNSGTQLNASFAVPVTGGTPAPGPASSISVTFGEEEPAGN